MPAPLAVTFVAGSWGGWRIETISTLVGEPLAGATHLDVIEGTGSEVVAGAWTLRGFTSNVRYATRDESAALADRQAGLARPEARRAVLIPIRKNAAWWAMAQDERRRIFEEQSRHIRIGMDALPEVARRLHHYRDLGEPFDFLTWFEFAPAHDAAFSRMVNRLRETAEWRYVDREVEIHLRR